MAKRLFFKIISILLAANCLAQPYETYIKSFDPNPQFPYGYDNSSNIWSIDGYIYVTNLYGDSSGINRQTQIFKIDANSKEIVKRINLPAPQMDIAGSGRGGYCITADKHILLTGEWRDYANTRMRTFIAKLDKDLNIDWINYYPDQFEFHAYGDAVAETPSGDILLYLTEGKPYTLTNPWVSGENVTRILKTDALGNVLFNKIVADTFFQTVGYGHLSRMVDGNYLLSSQLVGLNYNDPNPNLGTFQYNALLHKIDENANTIWSRLVNYSTFLLQEPTSIALPGGGGAVMWSRDTFGAPAEVVSNFLELNCLDPEGHTLWRHAWLDQSSRYIYRIISAANGDILGVGAYTIGFPSKGKAVIFRTTQDGEMLWERHYSDSIQRPWSYFTEMFDICELADGRIAATGVVLDTNSVGLFNPNIGILVVGADGCIEPGCTGVDQFTTGTFETVINSTPLPQLVCFPNPASNFVSIQRPPGILSASNKQILRAYNSQGAFIANVTWREGANMCQLDVNNWSPGVYQLVLWEGNRPILSGKISVNH